MIRMLLSDMLLELGYAVAAEAGHIDEAMAVAQKAEFDLAILDVNLAGQTIAPVAKVLEGRSLPFVFATGYGLDDLPDGFRERPTLRKPYQLTDLQTALQSAFAGNV